MFFLISCCWWPTSRLKVPILRQVHLRVINENVPHIFGLNYFYFLEQPFRIDQQTSFSVVAGEQGIGKTSLLNKIKEILECNSSLLNISIYECFSGEHRSSLPLSGFHCVLLQVLRSLLPFTVKEMPTEDVASFNSLSQTEQL